MEDVTEQISAWAAAVDSHDERAVTAESVMVDSGTSRRQEPGERRRAVVVAVVLVIACSVTAAVWFAHPDSSSVVTGGGGSTKTTRPPATSTTDSDIEDKRADALGAAAPGDRTPVGGPNHMTGYVNWDVIGGRTADTPKAAPIYAEGGPSSDEGKIIGYWGLKIGWIDKAVYESPDFDYEQRLSLGGGGTSDVRDQAGDVIGTFSNDALTLQRSRVSRRLDKISDRRDLSPAQLDKIAGALLTLDPVEVMDATGDRVGYFIHEFVPLAEYGPLRSEAQSIVDAF